MSTNTARYIALQRDLTKSFREAVATAEPFYPQICNIVQSNGADEKYGFLGAMPGVREWLGDRQFNKLRAADFVISNKKWENSLEFEKDDIDDDRTGMFGMVTQEFGNEAALHPDELLVSALVAGESTACFDGQYFFDTDHSWGDSGSQSNDLTYAAATGTTPTAAEFRAAFHQARTAMLKFVNDQGKKLNRPVSMGMQSLLCVVPPEQEVAAKEGLTAAILSNNSNVVIDSPRIVCMPGLTDATKFYLFNLTGVMRPFVFQARKPIQPPTWKGADDPEYKVLKLMTDARYNIGYLAWWKAVVTTWT